MPPRLLMTAKEAAADPARWHAFRRHGPGPGGWGITATDLAILLRLVPHSYGVPYSLFTEKITGTPLTGDSDEMARGRALEPYITARLASMRPELAVLPGALWSAGGDRDWMMATFDAFTVDCAGLGLGGTRADDLPWDIDPLDDAVYPHVRPAEYKTVHENGRDPALPGDWWGEPGTDEIPGRVAAQVYWQMAVSGCGEILVVAQHMLAWKTVIYRVTRTPAVEADITMMTEVAQAFRARLFAGDPPEPDWTPEAAWGLRTLHPMAEGEQWRCPPGLARRLRAAYRNLKAAEQRMGAVENAIGAKMGAAERAVTADPERDGRDVLVMRRGQGTARWTDREALARDYPAAFAATDRSKATDFYAAGQRWVKLGKRP